MVLTYIYHVVLTVGAVFGIKSAIRTFNIRGGYSVGVNTSVVLSADLCSLTSLDIPDEFDDDMLEPELVAVSQPDKVEGEVRHLRSTFVS
ncbi:hypothetical protein ElyMa_006580900 [Elysia marginata]|uniref:Uncharacterized protein n=1 Tax=Elysia marginata TaxID=1093978 RepID=A0AAV4II25_9GAST|nr:hypothetical protein ElyMa_006580900 [Elysia marginata]